MGKEILIDCVVKPVTGACVSAVAMTAARVCCDKVVGAIKEKRKKAEKPEPKGLLHA